MNEYNNNWHSNPEREKVKPKNFFQRNLLAVIFAGVAVVAVLALLLVLLRPAAPTNVASQSSAHLAPTTVPPTPTVDSSGATAPTDTPAAAATPTQASAVTAGTVLCQYDMTKGFNNWINSTQWKPISNGMLGSAGTDSGSDGSKYITWSGCSQFPTANYAVETQIQFVRNANTNYSNFEFGIMLRGDGTASGYEVGAGQDSCNGPTLAMVSLVQDGQTGNAQCGYGPAPLSGSGSSHGYKIDTDWHTYRAEVTGNIIRLFIDGNKLLETNDNTFTDVGQVGLRDVNGDINVKSFKVTSL